MSEFGRLPAGCRGAVIIGFACHAGDQDSIPLGVACHKSHCRTQSIFKNLSACRTCSHSEKQNVRQTTYRNNSSNGWRTNPERYSESNKQHSNSFQKTTRVLLSFNNCTIQSQQLQDEYASKSRMVGKLVPHAGELNKYRSLVTSQRKIVF